MSNRILREYAFRVQGDGAGNVLEIDLRQHIESQPTLGNASPTGVDAVSIVAIGTSPTPPAISFTTIAKFILTVTFAAALQNAPNNGYNLNVGLLFEGSL